MSRFGPVFQIFVAATLFLPSIAHAYVDPGTGSAIVTMVLGFFAAISYTYRKYLYKIKRMLSGRRSGESNTES